MSKKILLVAMSLLCVAVLAVGGTLAYFTDKDSATNVMTLGGVDIIQNEQERTEDGSLEDFTQDKPLMPAVDTREDKTANPIVNGYFDPAYKNVVDKIVTVTNEHGENEKNKDAYVRTIIAFETATEYVENSEEIRRGPVEIFNTYIGVVGKGLTYTDIVVEIDGVQYVIAYKVYEDALAPGQTTEPSLKQVFMSPDADNEITELFMNTYTILALSQGTQTAGFDSAEVALNTAFGEINAENCAAWLAEVE